MAARFGPPCVLHRNLPQLLSEHSRARSRPQSLLLDILFDENGVSFHRLQVVIWTLVMTLIFVVSVYTHLDMPDFDTKLLALMGISNGIYIGFKLPEKQVAAPS